MGRRPRAGTEEGASWIKVTVRLTANEYVSLRDAAKSAGSTMADVAREAVKGYLLGMQLESWHVKGDTGYYPPLTQPGLDSEGEARVIAAQIGGKVVKRVME